MTFKDDVKMLLFGRIPPSKRFFILTQLPTLNEYTNASRANKYGSAAIKKNVERSLQWEIKMQLGNWHTDRPVFLVFEWYEKNQRRDKDNVAFAKKFIQDALVKAGVLQGDGWKHVTGFIDLFEIDKDRPRVEVSIMEVQTDG